jgi:tetraprenyl-beta-curcumene synthase
MLASARDIAEFQAHSRPAAAPDELERWASALAPRAPRLSWWETAAACGSSLTVHALIAAASTPRLDHTAVERLDQAYGAQIGALHSMLDSLIDEEEDMLIGQPSLIRLYPGSHTATRAMGDLVEEAMRAARSLPQGRRHTVLLAAMASLYLSDPRARSSRAAPVATAVRARIGWLARPAMAVFAAQRLSSRHVTPRAKRRTNAPAAKSPDPEQPADPCARAA